MEVKSAKKNYFIENIFFSYTQCSYKIVYILELASHRFAETSKQDEYKTLNKIGWNAPIIKI